MVDILIIAVASVGIFILGMVLALITVAMRLISGSWNNLK